MYKACHRQGVRVRHTAKVKQCKSKGCTNLASVVEYALDMGQRSSDAVLKNATTMSSKEECVLNMECRSSYEGAKDAQIAGGGVCKRHGPTHSQTVQYISKSYKPSQVGWGVGTE